MAKLSSGKALRPTLAFALGLVLICSLGAGKNRPMAARGRSVPRLPTAVLEPAEETAIEVLPIDPDRREGVQQAAAELDNLLAKRHAERGVQPGANYHPPDPRGPAGHRSGGAPGCASSTFLSPFFFGGG